MLDCYGHATLGDGPGVYEEMRLIYGDQMPPQYVDPWGNPVEVPRLLDSELMATSAGEGYREFWRNWSAPITADPELTTFHVRQRDFYETMPAAPLTRAPYGPTILYRPEDAAPREPVVTDVQYLAPVTGYGPQPVSANLDPYGLDRPSGLSYMNTGIPADGYGPPTPVFDSRGDVMPLPMVVNPARDSAVPPTMDVNPARDSAVPPTMDVDRFTRSDLQPVNMNVDPYGLDRPSGPSYMNTGIPADGYGPPAPVFDPQGNVMPLPIALNPVTGAVPMVGIGTEPRPTDRGGYVFQPGDGPVSGGNASASPASSSAPWWLAIAALLAATA
jgi:hypothetical protein